MVDERNAMLADWSADMEGTARCIAEKMRAFLKKGARVLICFEDSEGTVGGLFRRAVELCEAVPVFWGPDRRWKALLKQAFFCKAGTVIGPPLLILGLTKLSRAMATPLYVRHAVIAGDSCGGWMTDGIANGLDCRVLELSNLVTFSTIPQTDAQLLAVGDEIIRWSSVLDCRMRKGPGGLEIEIVVFPGEKLPRLPSCARLTVRAWEPETDVPFCISDDWTNHDFSGESH